MELSITAVIQRLTCPHFASFHPDEHQPDQFMPVHLQGQVLHAIVESYLREEQVAAAFNLLSALPADQALRSQVMHRACNLISFANLLTAGASLVETEVPMHFSLSLPVREVHMHGRCDCLVIRGGKLVAVDWKPSPRLDRLDQLQVMSYLYAALIDRDLERGEWLLYYYDQGVIRRGHATRQDLETILLGEVERALYSDSLRPGGHCAVCHHRRECVVSAYAVG